MLVDVGDTRLHVEERGAGGLALIALHGGPGLDHTMFGEWLAPPGAPPRPPLLPGPPPPARRRALAGTVRAVGAGDVDARAARARRRRARDRPRARALRRPRPL